MTPPPADDRRRVDAPGLRETADVWFDVGRDPVIEWDEAGRRYELVDPGDAGNRLLVATLDPGDTDPRRVAVALAEGLAACDFPPTGRRASPHHVALALRAAGLGLDPT